MNSTPDTGPGPIAKRAHTKSKRGCKECKKRKVKCDEERPLCKNCRRRWGDIGKCDFEDVDSGSGSARMVSASVPRLQHSIKAEPKWIGPEADIALAKSRPAGLLAQRGALSPASPLMRTIQGHRVDPFGTHPHSNTNDVDILLKHYPSSVVFQSFPWQPKSEKNPVIKFYAPMVLADPIMVHATLQLSAVRLEIRLPSFHVQSKKLMGECIRLLNNRVRDPLLNISDQTIGAVAILATIEYERGNTRVFNLHLSGLKQMLKLRGGLGAIRQSSPILANMVFWTFLIAMGETTTLQLEPDEDLETPQWLVAARQTFGPTPQLGLRALGVSSAVASAAADIKHLSQRFVRHSDYASADECLSALTVVCDILRRVLSTPPVPVGAEAEAETTKGNGRGRGREMPSLQSEATRMAIALLVMTPWRGLRPDPALVVNDLVHRLKACMAPLLLSVEPSHSPPSELLLWLLFTGGVSAKGSPERAWFTKHLVDVVRDVGLTEWVEVRAVMKEIVWHEILCERSYRALWDEVRAWKDDLDSSEL